MQVGRLWATGLVHTVREEAVGLDSPSVLVNTITGNASVAVVAIGPCILAWPLRAQRHLEEVVLTWVTEARLEELFISDPFSTCSPYLCSGLLLPQLGPCDVCNCFPAYNIPCRGRIVPGSSPTIFRMGFLNLCKQTIAKAPFQKAFPKQPSGCRWSIPQRGPYQRG